MVPKSEESSPSIMPKTRQVRHSKLSNPNSKIPVKNRQVSVPIEPLDESSLGNVKRSSIPRITSSPLTSSVLERKTLTPIVNKDLNLSTPKSSKMDQKIPTPPSTVGKLAHQLSSLSLESPSRKSLKKNNGENLDIKKLKNELPKQSAEGKKSRLVHNIQDKPKLSSPKEQESTSSPYLGNRTSMLLRSRVKNHDIPSNSPLSPSKGGRKVMSHSKSTRSISLNNPYHKSTPNNPNDDSVNKSTNPVKSIMKTKMDSSDDSPLIARLTRSTTASNLKSNAKLPRSSTISGLNTKVRSFSNVNPVVRKPSSSRIPSNSSIPMVPENSNLNSNSKLSNLPNPLKSTFQRQPPPQEKLVVPKRRSNMTKSFSINVGIKDLTKQESPIPTPKPTTRVASYQKPRFISRSRANTPTLIENEQNEKIATLGALQRCLFNFEKTRSILKGSHSQVQSYTGGAKDPTDVINGTTLTSYEKAEILKNGKVYYIGHKRSRNSLTRDFTGNFGFDDKDKNLIVEVGDHIAYRYQVLSKLGRGMFGNVMKCHDHKTGKDVSLKVMKNDITWSLQCINEIKILKKMRHPKLLEYYEHLNFRSHICISTELLGVNLYEALEATKFKGFDIKIIKKWSRDLLSGLDFIHKQTFVHADLKPENIMLVSPDSLDIKIIDFGSSSTVGDISYPYIQSRYYRAPEILLGCRYNEKIDIWSFITLVYELYHGDPLFAAKDETQLFSMMMKLIGVPPSESVISMRNDLFRCGSVNKKGDSTFVDKRVFIFTKFDDRGKYKGLRTDSRSAERTNFNELKAKEPIFENFLLSGLVWNYKERPSAQKLLNHEFLS